MKRAENCAASLPAQQQTWAADCHASHRCSTGQRAAFGIWEPDAGLHKFRHAPWTLQTLAQRSASGRKAKSRQTDTTDGITCTGMESKSAPLRSSAGKSRPVNLSDMRDITATALSLSTCSSHTSWLAAGLQGSVLNRLQRLLHGARPVKC